jgi:hypothetical protein
VTSLLGLFLLFCWMQERIQALAWWQMTMTKRVPKSSEADPSTKLIAIDGAPDLRCPGKVYPQKRVSWFHGLR